MIFRHRCYEAKTASGTFFQQCNLAFGQDGKMCRIEDNRIIGTVSVGDECECGCGWGVTEDVNHGEIISRQETAEAYRFFEQLNIERLERQISDAQDSLKVSKRRLEITYDPELFADGLRLEWWEIAKFFREDTKVT